LSIHIGHHFFGAGNVGDDLMLAGFLRTVPETYRGKLTCCVPFDRSALALRFPEVEWLPYDDGSRNRAIRSCQVWLGLGGSPFQSAVSRWFVDHLAQEARLCEQAGKPMYFLGVGGQDPAAFEVPEIQSICRQARTVWTRDQATADRVAKIGGSAKVAADLAHVHLAAVPPPAARSGRLTAVLNFDFADWPGLPAFLKGFDALNAGERVWAAQESRELPGAERWLHARLSAPEQALWRLQPIERGSVADSLSAWPTGEWQISSRYHATLVAAWAGSKTVVLATNEKLRGAASETRFPLVEMNAGRHASEIASQVIRLFQEPPPPHSRDHLQRHAALAAKACAEFFAAVG
jgi:polysaccharide pyruvyl transferase WcaK-like protein